MNGRVFAVNRSPVLAWNVEPQIQVPYPDMPAAAAAAISPIVPAASDPYGRCWQNQVDAGTSFPYFGTLYNNSLPPTAYRLQPGCMANLGQFWPPTPPPDGCGRFDGSNLYFGAPVIRHTENTPSNVRSFQGLGHYSHLVENPKEPNQRTFKRETPVSPIGNAPSVSMCASVTKSDNLNSYCVVDSKLKSQVSFASSLPKQELHTVPSSGHESYLCAPDVRSSSSMHPSTDKACFSPSYSLKNALNYHNSSQDNTHKAKSLPGNQENNCNASPLKNVYFSHFESENVNSVHSKNFDKNSDARFRFDQKNSSLDVHKTKHSHHSPNNFLFHNNYSSKKYDFQGAQEYCSSNPNCSITKGERVGDGGMLVKEQYRSKNSVFKVKPEKNTHSDCKYQKCGSKNSTVVQSPACRNSDSVFNIPTSVMHPKVEPNEKYFLPSCSSAPSCMATSYTGSAPFLFTKDFATDLRTGAGYRNMIYTNSCSLAKPWRYSELPNLSPDSYFKAPEAAKPPSQGLPSANSALHEGLISVAQTAPQDIDVLKMTGKLHHSVHPFTKKISSSEIDDDVQIIGVQTKHSSSKHGARISSTIKTDSSKPLSVTEPLCLMNEKERIPSLELHQPTSSLDQSIEKVQQLNEPSSVSKGNIKPKLEDKNIVNVDNCVFQSENTKLKVQTEQKIKSNSHDVVVIKQEESEEPVVSDISQKSFEESFICKTELESNDASSSNLESDVKPSVNDLAISSTKSVDAKEEELLHASDFNENHGLTLLLNTIEKVTSLESRSSLQRHSPYKSDFINPTSDSGKVGPELCTKTRGLDLLSVIAGQRLVSEFDNIKPEPEDDSNIKSNYPDIKENKILCDDEHSKQITESSSSLKSSVFEMQDRLVELQKKYKQKQKELSRLKPKKRLANTYLKGRRKSVGEVPLSSCVSTNTSSCSATRETNNPENSIIQSEVELQSKNTVPVVKTIKTEKKDNFEDNKTKRRLRDVSIKQEILSETSLEIEDKRITRRSSLKYSLKRVKSKSGDEGVESVEIPRKITRSSKTKTCELRKIREPASNNSSDEVQILSSEPELTNKESTKKSASLPDNSKRKSKVYSLRHPSQSFSKKQERMASNSAANLKTISSKRKSDNPKKYMPSKQSKLSETIIAKHLRSRILFDTSGSVSEDDNIKDGVPEELYDALMKCHLGDENKSNGIKSKREGNLEIPSGNCMGFPEPSILKAENLIEKQRLLALEDGLFYSGCIKEVQVSDRYGVALDGQRGNRLHVFTREELLSQTIVESKPISSELPEGTRVCAYWSQQYRCLYPGIVGKAPCPSADWSEPRVFVLFDDGDSGQIPTKNVRLIPTDIIPSENESKLSLQSPTNRSSNMELESRRGDISQRLRRSTSRILKRTQCDTSNENESKESSCASINESSCDDSCFIDYCVSSSQTAECRNSLENSACSLSNSTDTTKIEKRQRKRSKRKTAYRIEINEIDSVEAKEKCEAKSKHHKKYKDKHRRHHHRHHHHRHHHRRRHHSKKRKHRRKNSKSLISQDLNNENFIPCNANHKSCKNFQRAAENCTDHVEHSSTVNLPQNEQDRVC